MVANVYKENTSKLGISKGDSFILVSFISVAIFFAWYLVLSSSPVSVFLFRVYDFEQPLFFGWSASFWTAAIFFLEYWFQCFGIISADSRGLQTHLGKYTGIEFGPGWYVVVKYPIPFINIIAQMLGKENPLGWSIEKQVTIAANQTEVKRVVQLVTRENILVTVTMGIIFRVTNMTTKDLYGQTLDQIAANEFVTLFRKEANGIIGFVELVRNEISPEFLRRINQRLKSEGCTIENVCIEGVHFQNRTIEDMFSQLMAEEVSEAALRRKTAEMFILKRTFPEMSDVQLAAIYAAFMFANSRS